MNKLKEVLEERDEHIKNNESVSAADIKFHTMIAKASGNDILALVYQILSRLGQQSELFEQLRKKATGGYRSSHWEIYEAIRERDGRNAEKSLIKHMEALISDMQKYWKDHPELGKPPKVVEP